MKFDKTELTPGLYFVGVPIGTARDITLRALDTLAIARKRFPGSPASLDALCRRFGIDNGARTLHGALLSRIPCAREGCMMLCSGGT